ncbi:MAG: hypothetical protein KDN19_11395 [Verrucomicrobiae bacterium]|nr:hypothetical protein [Verrucomicrobiae bacterium]
MQISVLNLAATGSVSFDVLIFWILLFVAILWYLIWLLLKSGTPAPTVPDHAETVGQSQKAPASPSTEAPSAAPAAAKPEPVTEKPTPPVDEVPEEAKAEPEPKPTEEDGTPAIETASAEQATTQFQAEIDSGKARFDDAYGVVYHAPPEKSDDLKKIKGVAKVLEGKLNAHGVYTYRQIAFWTAPAAKEFSKLLPNFKDRIYRDDWIAQAKELHEAKYGEKL